MRSVGRSGIGEKPATASFGANRSKWPAASQRAARRTPVGTERLSARGIAMTTETEEKESSQSFLRGDDVGERRRWRTRTSRMSSLHEPVPTGVYLGFFGSALFFVMLHFFNQWWFDIDLDR